MIKNLPGLFFGFLFSFRRVFPGTFFIFQTRVTPAVATPLAKEAIPALVLFAFRIGIWLIYKKWNSLDSSICHSVRFSMRQYILLLPAAQISFALYLLISIIS